VNGRRFAIALGVAAVIGGGLLRWRHEGAPSHRASGTERVSPLSFVPPGPAFVLSADIAALRRAAIGRMIAKRLNGMLGASSSWSKLCDFDPLVALDQVALAMPSSTEGEPGTGTDVAFVATGSFSAAQITRCATAAIGSRGGDPVTSQIGTFSTVRDRKTTDGEVAARNGGPLILSGGAYFRELLDAAEGHAPKLEHQDPRDAEHSELRRAVGAGTVVASWLPGAHWLERIAGEGAQLSPLKELRAVALRADLADSPRLIALLACSNAAAANQIYQLLLALSTTLDPKLAALNRRVVMTQNDGRLRLELALSEAELEALVDATTVDADAPPSRSAPPKAQISPSSAPPNPPR